MPQTVYDVGDLITSRFDLGVTPDGTTDVTVRVWKPNGIELTGIVPGPWTNVTQKTAQWYATDNGTAGGPITAGVADGDWLAVWTATGTGASVSPKIYNVRRLPVAGTRMEWVPFLSDVADHVPWLTVSLSTPGDQTYLGTFTGDTAPSDEQAMRHIDQATAIIGARLGTLPAALYPAVRAAVALRAAASLALAFPRDATDVNTAQQLSAAAATAWAELRAAADAADVTPSLTPQPVAYAPAPNWWGDLNL